MSDIREKKTTLPHTSRIGACYTVADITRILRSFSDDCEVITGDRDASDLIISYRMEADGTGKIQITKE